MLLQIVNALSFSLLLYMLTSGFSLIFGFMRVANMCHGVMYLLGSYVAYTAIKVTGSFLLAGLGAAAMVALVGLVINPLLNRILFGKELEQVLLTFGLLYAFEDIMKWIWGTAVLSIQRPAAIAGTVMIFGFGFPTYRLVVIGVGMGIVVGLWLFIQKTRVGIIIRAGIDDRDMVNASGINVMTYFTIVFVIGSALAGLAGWLGAGFLQVYPGLDLTILIFSLIVVVIGGLGNLTGALIGSLIIGFAHTFGRAYSPEYGAYVPHAVMFVTLLVLPGGLMSLKRQR